MLKPEYEGSDTLVETFQRLVREQVGAHARPRAIEFVASLPKAESGKIQRYLLRQRERQVTSD